MHSFCQKGHNSLRTGVQVKIYQIFNILQFVIEWVPTPSGILTGIVFHLFAYCHEVFCPSMGMEIMRFGLMGHAWEPQLGPIPQLASFSDSIHISFHFSVPSTTPILNRIFQNVWLFYISVWFGLVGFRQLSDLAYIKKTFPAFAHRHRLCGGEIWFETCFFFFIYFQFPQLGPIWIKHLKLMHFSQLIFFPLLMFSSTLILSLLLIFFLFYFIIKNMK